MSSAILYLAIIAIWAGFLVPAWIRRPHSHPASQPEHEVDVAHSEAEYTERDVEYVTDTEDDVDVTVAADIHVEVTRHEHVHAEHEEHAYQYGEYEEHAYSALTHSEDAPAYAGQEQAADGYGAAEAGAEHPRLAQSREQMLRARRRMLTILVAMTAVTMAFAAMGSVRWWICVPPAGMLVLYVLLLREIAMADAEVARKRATWEAARARAYRRHMQAVAEREAYESSLADPGAQIIDISGRVAEPDQLYDQYADAAVRAVGD